MFSGFLKYDQNFISEIGEASDYSPLWAQVQYSHCLVAALLFSSLLVYPLISSYHNRFSYTLFSYDRFSYNRFSYNCFSTLITYSYLVYPLIL